MMSFTPTSHHRAIEFLRHAISLDPNFALAFAVLGWVYSMGIYVETSLGDSYLKAEKVIAKALEIDGVYRKLTVPSPIFPGDGVKTVIREKIGSLRREK